jgi:hypothetical protein
LRCDYLILAPFRYWNNLWKPLGSIATPVVAQRIIKISARFQCEKSVESATNLGAAAMTNSDIQVKELLAMNVGVLNDDGRLEAAITLEEFLRVARSQGVFFHTKAPPGEIKFDLTISNTGDIIGKVEDWRKKQRKKVEVTGVVFG